MCYFDVILLRDVISSIGPTISEADTYLINFCIAMNRIWLFNIFYKNKQIYNWQNTNVSLKVIHINS